MQTLEAPNLTPILDSDLRTLVECPACGSSSFAPADTIRFRNRRLHYSRCKQCNLMFMNPMPLQHWYDKFYAEEFWEDKAVIQGATGVGTHTAQWRKEINRARELYRFLGDHARRIGGNGAVLEIGCAFGLVSRWLGERLALTPLGVEPSDAASEFAKNHSGVTIVARTAGGLEGWDPKVPLRLVIMSHVLENICDPRGTLELIRRKLAPGGLLLIETPNPLIRQACSIYHPYAYSKHAISEILTRSGFDLLSYEASGQPRTSWLPLYQRMLATPSDIPVGTTVVRDKASPTFPVLRKFGTAANFLWGLSPPFLGLRSRPTFDAFDERLLGSVQDSVVKAAAAEKRPS